MNNEEVSDEGYKGGSMRSFFEAIQKLQKEDEGILKRAKSLEKITNERQVVIQDFLNQLNPAREKAGYKPLAPKVLAIKLGHIPTDDLKAFYQICSKSNSFGKCFWGRLKQ